MENYFSIIRRTVTSIKPFIDFWSKLYKYPPEKEELQYHIPISKDALIKKDLELLFLWKNGTKLSKKKGDSVENKIISKLDKINELKKGSIKSIDEVKKICPDLTAAIWLIFLTHIINKEEFPIFDMHVFRAYKFITTKEIEEIPDNDKKKLQLYEEYLEFYHSLGIEKKDYKKWDEAMWSFGKFLTLKSNKGYSMFLDI